MKRLILFTVMVTMVAGVSLCAETKAMPKILINGKDFSPWSSYPSGKNTWTPCGEVKMSDKDKKFLEYKPGEGIIVNGPKGNTENIVTKEEFGDCELHIEFMVPQGSNSGVYLQGLYEIQVFDSFGKEKVIDSDCGGLYKRWDEKNNKPIDEGFAPKVNASKAPGEWQNFDAVFRAPRFDKDGKKTANAKFISVKHNDVLIHENVERDGGTRACMNRPESPKGPLMLQGDHGPVAYRNVKIKPIELP